MLLALSALTGPDTPGSVLGAVAAHYRATGAFALLLAHPNTPTTELTSDPLDVTSLQAALRSPALTPTTRALVLSAATDDTLVALTRSPVRLYPRAVIDELTTRLHADTLTDAGAVVLIDHPWATPRTQVAALRHVLATDLSDLFDQREAPSLSCALMAALRHPRHLHELAEVCAHPALQETLRQCGMGYDAGRDVLAEQVQHGLRVIADHRDTGSVRFVPHEQVARAALDVSHGHHHAADTIVTTNALVDSPVWWAAWACRSGHTYDYDTDQGASALAVHDTTMLDVTCATSPVSAVDALDHGPLTPAVLRASAATLERVAPTDADHTAMWVGVSCARHAARLLAHPSTPPELHPQVRARLHTALAALPAGCLGDDDPVWLLAQHSDVSDILTHVPLPQIQAAAECDTVIATALAAHAAAHLAPAWADPGATQAVLALEGTFTGTLPELVATATTIST